MHRMSNNLENNNYCYQDSLKQNHAHVKGDCWQVL